MTISFLNLMYYLFYRFIITQSFCSNIDLHIISAYLYYMDRLPLDIHIEIVRYLPLRDALAYSQACTVAFDAVYYVFAHRDELDFSSVLDANNTIALQNNMILSILHAHTRASVIINFCLPHTFTLFAELDQYLSLYWTKHTNMDQTAAVGHPMGTLQRIS